MISTAGNSQIPLSAIARFEYTTAPLVIAHQEQFPAVTISFDLAPDASLGDAVQVITQAERAIGMPTALAGSYSGDAAEFAKSLAGQPWLILAAAIAIYIVLGVLYESFIHPFTILTTLPSAGVGALLALMWFKMDLSVVALIGIILLMGIVKKNAIMIIDFALEAERKQGLTPHEAIVQASILRFRPIMMTTLAALFGAIPLAVEQGTGSELRNPLGITIIGGLLLSQLLTLYTTPVIYLAMERLKAKFVRAAAAADRARSARERRAGARPRSDRMAVQSFSEVFIRRPVGTTLLAIGLLLVGVVAYRFLPVASMPTVEFPTISVTASRPGADPETMAATVAAPLERRLGEIPGVTELTSRSSLGSTRISVQFDLNRNIDGAARDVQAAINAALTDLPGDLQSRPSFRKANPAATPIMILALTSKTVPPSALYDAADTVIAQRLSQVDGVAEVSVNGAEQPAIRVRVNPLALASMGLDMEAVRTAIANTNAAGPLGVFDGPERSVTIATNDQLRTASDYDPIVVRTANGAVVRLSAVASIEPSVRNSRSAGWFNGQPSVLLVITKQADANVIETVDQIYALLPELKRWIPAGIDISVLSDRTGTIRASVADMQLTLLATICLVMLVVFVFLRRAAATIAAGVTVPLSLAGTCAAMWVAGFSIDNLSLMALAVSVGFVVDDAIVMIENCFRNLEKGMTPMMAAIDGARQIGFTVLSISISLVAAFIPLLFMTRRGRARVPRILRDARLRHHGLDRGVADGDADDLRAFRAQAAEPGRHLVRPAGRAGAGLDGARLRPQPRGRARLSRAHAAGDGGHHRHHRASSIVRTPKGFFPQDDTGLIFGGTRASTEVSFQTMYDLQQKAEAIVRADPAVAGVGSSIGSSGWSASVNRGTLFISLKPLAERGGVTTQDVVNRLRQKTANIPGLTVFFFAMQDVRVGGRQSDATYQYTLWDANYRELLEWAPRVLAAIQKVPGLVDVSTDREQGGLQVNIDIDRVAAARLGVRIQDIANTLNNAYAQRQISTLYTQRNQYRVILEVDPQYQRDPVDLARLYVNGANNTQVPITAVTKITRGLSPLVVNHQGQFPAITISFGLGRERHHRGGDAS